MFVNQKKDKRPKNKDKRTKTKEQRHKIYNLLNFCRHNLLKCQFETQLFKAITLYLFYYDKIQQNDIQFNNGELLQSSYSIFLCYPLFRKLHRWLCTVNSYRVFQIGNIILLNIDV